MASNHNKILLQEYQQCDEKTNRLDSLIWTMAAIIFPITLAGISYFGLSSTHTTNQFILVVIVGLGSITLLLFWYFLSRTWASYQSIAYYRMREIEKELGMWHYRYSLFLRKTKFEQINFLKTLDKKDKLQYEYVGKNVKGFVRIGLRKTTMVVVIIFVLGWICLIIREYSLSL